jgi:hypothetical protein
MGSATAGPIAWYSLEVPAPNVEDGIHKQIKGAGPQISKRDALSMPEQPGGLVIGRTVSLLQGADPECH